MAGDVVNIGHGWQGPWFGIYPPYNLNPPPAENRLFFNSGSITNVYHCPKCGYWCYGNAAHTCPEPPTYTWDHGFGTITFKHPEPTSAEETPDTRLPDLARDVLLHFALNPAAYESERGKQLVESARAILTAPTS